ncbi:MAG: hypothetical protein MJD61_13245 [Proteobacteria bacterium]|nr:hypothetical protein [Pseudomonadota bacterium]
MPVGPKANLGWSAFATVAVAACLLVQDLVPVRAQTVRPSAQHRVAAARAYDRGTALYLAGEYAGAAQWFETADRMAPAAPALLQAIRAHQRAGNALRAASLSLRLLYEYPKERKVARYARSILAKTRGQFLRVEARCVGAWLLINPEQNVLAREDCTIELDGILQEHPSFFVAPGATHRIVAHFRTGDVAKAVSGKKGDSIVVEFRVPLKKP